MTRLLNHAIQWVTAPSLWDGASAPAQMRKPAILRFTTDSFMDDIKRELGTTPAVVADRVATPRSYRERTSWDTQELTQLKLYQPAHGHFYLIAASLVCRLPGLPLHPVDPGKSEAIGFILRRLNDDGSELAWVKPPGGKKAWTSADASALASDEELLPLFPMSYVEGETKRRLLVGLIPTSSRETFEAAAAVAPPQPGDQDARLSEVTTRVVTPLASLQSKPDGMELADAQESSRFLLLDLADFLQAQLPSFLSDLGSATPPAAGSASRAFYDVLQGTTVGGTNATWRSAVTDAWNNRTAIPGDGTASGTWSPGIDLRDGSLTSDALLAALSAALSATPAVAAAAAAPEIPKLLPSGQPLYVLRCVYRRPRCGALQPDLISDPSDAFQIAPFFDFDAPARPIRITLPFDTSIAGLRKFKKNVAIVMSDSLRKQMAKSTKALDKKVGSSPDFKLGEICSFSIPIITICAMILLMIVLSLLDIIFFWMPFLKICFPIDLKKKVP